MATSPRDLFVILGNQLVPFRHLRPHRDAAFFMAEDLGLCTYVRHHKQKIALFLAAMRAHADELRRNGCALHYESLNEQAGAELRTKYETKLARYADRAGPFDRLLSFEVEDLFFERRLDAVADELGLERVTLASPMFLCSRERFAGYARGATRLRMADFYERQRRHLGILIDSEGAPVGGRWSFDRDNREKLPRDEPLPAAPAAAPTDHVRALIALVGERFADHPGELSEAGWWLPSTRRQALAWLRGFLDERLERFGSYEDALSTRGPVLFHSVLSPLLNLGLITPDEVVERTLAHAEDHRVPLNSLEGFLRQIIGWREFVRGVYRGHSEQQETANAWGHHRRMKPCWWDASTGLRPLDDAIAKVLRMGWAHHIERLMVLCNLMNLCEIEPRQVHDWFLAMFVDAADWVMGPNVYGMGLMSDGGLFATKPYICASNYLLKMSDYGRPAAGEVFPFGDSDWCTVVDGLYWRFVREHRDFFAGHPRMAVMAASLDRMSGDKKQRIFAAASAFLDRVTETP